MKFTYEFKKNTPQMMKHFLKEQGISKGLLAKIKFQGGQILVNGVVQNARYLLKVEDQVTIRIPDEGEHETLLIDDTPIEIVFEDEHLLVVNKPAGIPSIPAQYHPNGTMANRVKAYYKKQDYVNQVIHVVTRLDRDTSGLMLFAKHGFAHAKMDVLLRKKQVVKKYQALLSGEIVDLEKHGNIQFPIARDLSSLLKRKVDSQGQEAHTEYWVAKKDSDKALVEIQLHTGRTHQIRVHFSAIDCPLLGDEMYGGSLGLGIERQALHCRQLSFIHPFSDESLNFESSLPADMLRVSESIVERGEEIGRKPGTRNSIRTITTGIES